MSYDRDALLNDLKIVLRKHMKREMADAELSQIHLDAVEWLSTCLALFGVSRDQIREHADRGEKAGRRIRQ